jgi:hypothetical protein
MRERKSVQNKVFLLSILSLTFLILCLGSVIAMPYGANVSRENDTVAPADDPDSINATAGNVSEITVYGFTTTKTWQGYSGNVTGVIQLADSSDNVMYNWTYANPKGEVYSSINDSINLNFIQCFN